MTKSMSVGTLAPIVERTYHSTSRLQWVRELIVNAMQAAATKIWITTEWQAVNALGVHRRMVIDNGIGISREDMLKFFNKFGGSGKALAALSENFGVGFKVSALPWNKHGVVVIAKQDGQVSLIWIHFDPKAGADGEGDYGAREFNIGDEETPLMDVVVPLDEFEEYVIDGVDWTKVFPGDSDGLAVVLTGNTGEEDTILGDPGRGESAKYAIEQYINGRFWDFPEGLEILISNYKALGFRSTWPKSEAGCDKRSPVGMAKSVAKAGIPTKANPGRGITGSGTLNIPSVPGMLGAKVNWTLYTEAVDTRGDAVTLPIVGVRFASHAGIHEIFHLSGSGGGADGKQQMNRWVRVSEVRDRMEIFIEVEATPGTTVFPDAGRTRLQWEDSVSGARDLPWETWHEYWTSNMPAEVRKAIDDYYAKLATSSSNGITDEDYKRLGEKYLDALKRVVKGYLPTKKVTATKGTVTGTAGVGAAGGGKRKIKTPGGDKSSARVRPDAAGTTGIRRGDVKLHLVEVHVAPHGLEPVIAFDVDGMKAVVNSDSDTYKRLRDYIVARYVDSGQIDPENEAQVAIVHKGLNKAVEIHGSLALTEIYAHAHDGSVSADVRDKLMNEHALGNILCGIRHIEEMASGFIGTSLSGKRRTVKAA